MNRLYSLFARGCVYTVAMTFLICLFGLGMEGTPSLPVGQFLVLTVIGMVLSLTQNIFLLQNMRLIYKILIHYGVILVLFELLFVLTGKITTGGPTGIFVSATVLTILYGLVFVAVFFLRKAILKNRPLEKKAPLPQTKQKEVYTPRYK